MDPIIINGLFALGGSTITLFVKAVVDLYKANRQANNADLEAKLTAAHVERSQIFADASKLRADLQQQILDLRKSVLDLQADNLKYVRENAELRQQVIHLSDLNNDLKHRIRELESQVSTLASGMMAKMKDDDITKTRIDKLEHDNDQHDPAI